MEKPDSLKELIKSIELNNYGIVWSLMQRRKNHHFFSSKVKKAKNAYFEFIPNSAKWSDLYSITPFTDRDGFKFEEISIDIKLQGTINEHNNAGRTFFSEAMELTLTIRAYFQQGIGVHSENISFLNPEQKALLEFHKKYEDELRRLGIKTIFETEYFGQEAFAFFTRIWKNVDNGNTTMVNDTSLNYFHELGEAHRNIMYSVSCANIWARYTSHFTDDFYRMERGNVYPHNPSFYDTRHIFYLEAAIEEIYTFYERIAYILYLFLNPTCFEAKALSYNKLFERQTVKELKLKFPGIIENEHFKWFLNRLKKEHKDLSGYRHPLIHYKTANTFIKGSYSASRTRHWLDNAMDETQLTTLHKQMEDILKFVNKELLSCNTAFEQFVLLCESIE